MSKLIRKPIQIVQGVTFQYQGGLVTVSGGKAKKPLLLEVPHYIQVKQEGESVIVSIAQSQDGDDHAKAMLGTIYARIRSNIEGAANGHKKKLQLVGVGYRALMAGTKLQLSLGYSHPIEYTPVEGVQVTCLSQTEVLVEGADKEAVGKVASDIRGFRRPEPYQGKGVRYANEHVRRKEAKKK